MDTILSWIRQHPVSMPSLIGLLIFLALHMIWRIRPSNITSATGIDAYLTNGKPTIIEFYSNL